MQRTESPMCRRQVLAQRGEVGWRAGHEAGPRAIPEEAVTSSRFLSELCSVTMKSCNLEKPQLQGCWVLMAR